MQLNFQSYGAGVPLIVLHGLFGSLDNWQNVSRELGKGYQVFALDLRNHGRSPHGDEFNYRIIVEDLVEFMAARQLERAHMLGHSMGGKVAMHFALMHPDKVGKLVVVDMAPRAYPPSHVPLFKAMLSLELGSFGGRNEMDQALASRIPEVAVRQFLLKNVTRDQMGGFRWKLNLPAIYRNYDQLNGQINTDGTFQGPTLFIRGGRSDYIAEGDFPLIMRLFPNARVATIPEAGHWVHADAPGKLTELVRDFLN